MALESSEMMQTFFGIQLGGAVSRVGDSDTAIPSFFRRASMLQETDADWLLSAYDDTYLNWTAGAGDDVANISGLEGSYCNEPDPALPAGVYESRFWGDHVDGLRKVKSKYDPSGFFECWQCLNALTDPVL